MRARHCSLSSHQVAGYSSSPTSLAMLSYIVLLMLTSPATVPNARKKMRNIMFVLSLTDRAEQYNSYQFPVQTPDNAVTLILCIYKASKSDIETFNQDILLEQEKRRKISCEVFSLCRPDPATGLEVEEGGQTEGILVRDVARFKSSLAAFPTRQSAVALDSLRR